jgi:hypothetical protein
MNECRRHGRIMQVVMVGDQNISSINQLDAATVPVANAIMNEFGQLDVLVDLRRAGKSDVAGRAQAVKNMRTMPYRRLALFGGSTVNRSLVNLMAKGARLEHKIRHFATRREALEWLEE